MMTSREEWLFLRTAVHYRWTGQQALAAPAAAGAGHFFLRTSFSLPFSAKPLYVCSATRPGHRPWTLAMRIPEHPTLIRRMLQARLKKLATTTPLLAASLSFYTHRCGRPACRCHHGGPLHTGQHLTFKDQGKTRSVYVPKDLLPEVRSWIAQHQRLKLLLQEIHLLSLALVRTHSQHQRRKAGRP